jgi:hypothetical protein
MHVRFEDVMKMLWQMERKGVDDQKCIGDQVHIKLGSIIVSDSWYQALHSQRDTIKITSSKLAVAFVAIDHQMVMIHVQVGNNFVEDVLSYGGYGVHIITKKLRV